MDDFHYVGSELKIFANAVNCKSYFRKAVRRYLGRDVLEVGAGCGATTAVLYSSDVNQWVCLKPDRGLVAEIEQAISAGTLPNCCRAAAGFLDDGPAPEESFDSVLYINVLEHIENDREELNKAVRFLRPGGHIVVLAPAHQWLFSPFDEAIGHFRRYTKAMLRRLTPALTRIVDLRYLDSVGLLASSGNRLLLRQAQPTIRQIEAWDGLMVPISRRIDPLLGFLIGKSVLCAWQREYGDPREQGRETG